MNEKLCLFGCHNFHTEVAAAIAAEGWGDVVAVEFPARCGRPALVWDELRSLLPSDCTQVIILGRACLNGLGEAPADFPPTRIVPVAQCFHMVAGKQLVDEAISGGGYLITSAWLADWRGQLKVMGFTPELGGEFFRDFAKELVLLDTGIVPDSIARLAELQAVLKLPARRVAVGLDHIGLLLSRLVLEWRLAQAQHMGKMNNQRHASELADHVAAMDMLVQLAKTQHEAEAIATIEDLFRMLFAPAALHYLRVENDVLIFGEVIPDATLDGLRRIQHQPRDHAWTEDGQGFLLRISQGEDVLGLIAVERLAFPAFRERYLNMALAITGVCGLAIENARNRKRLLEAEKMASLGILVAGVAHEINTPLGVGLTASTTLHSQARQLAERFAARSMTQSDLQQYLAAAETSTVLIQHNLERIGQLIDAFRQVAVHGQAPDQHWFGLRNCIDDVIRSLGNRLLADRIDLKIECDPALEIDSVPGDWVSVFVNLIVNSLKHGFRGREHGAIGIRVEAGARQLHIDYQDDGVGLTPETLARIFDPFYTTDLQQGMGLGMHLVYNLITHRFGGVIHCQSRLGEGVHFLIDVPIATRYESAA